MTEPLANYQLYEHRFDPSVLMVARPLENGDYEVRRYGEDASQAFTLVAEDFLAVYQKRRSA